MIQEREVRSVSGYLMLFLLLAVMAVSVLWLVNAAGQSPHPRVARAHPVPAVAARSRSSCSAVSSSSTRTRGAWCSSSGPTSAPRGAPASTG